MIALESIVIMAGSLTIDRQNDAGAVPENSHVTDKYEKERAS